jgi:hypothetical protein
MLGFIQIAVGVASLVLALIQGAKETAPYVQKYSEQHKQHVIKQQADEIARMNVPFDYRGNDGVYRYYSDSTNKYWKRVNIQGIVEYAQNPALIK